MVYRPEIDGLRAFAVLSVILFHGGYDWLKGGYVGVDVFFVISGYLITSVILKASDEEKFSFIKFYEKRARRILPALFGVMLFSFIISWFVFFSAEMKDFAQSLMAVSLSLSNILFWKEIGYFQLDADLKPLLHTWSLSIEEQFYLIFPILLIFIGRFREKINLVFFIFLFALSLFYSEFLLETKQDFVFYFLPTRAWELILGVLCCLIEREKYFYSIKTYLKNIFGLLGLFLLLISFYFFDQKTQFPGLMALIPTIGTGLIILFATQGTWVNQFLRMRLFVFIGLMSYSLYLWHQPLYAFLKTERIAELSSVTSLIVLVMTFLFGYLSWKYIESPFRNPQQISSKRVWQFSLYGIFIFFTLGLLGHMTQGHYTQSRLSPLYLDLEKRLQSNLGLHNDCEGSFTLSKNCRTSDKPEVLVWGDSFAMHLVPGLMKANPTVKLIQMTISYCGPIMEIAPIDNKYNKLWGKHCIESNQKVFDYIEQTKTLKYVVLSSYFLQYLKEDAEVVDAYGNKHKGQEKTFDYFLKTINRIKDLGIQPIIVSPLPQTGSHFGRCLASKEILKIDKEKCNFNEELVLQFQKAVFEFLKNVEKNVRLIWLKDKICTRGVCRPFQNNIFIYRDDGHLSYEGSEFILKDFKFDL